MSYRRFEMPANISPPATVATTATLSTPEPQTVAKLASVAGGARQAQISKPGRFSDLWDTEADYAQALIRYAAQDGLSLTAKDGRLIGGVGNKRDPDLLAELRQHEAAVIEAVEAATVATTATLPIVAGEPRALRPPIVKVPPFGCDHVPDRYLPAWQALLAQCPPGVTVLAWQAAIFDAAMLFGDFGKLIDEYRWTARDLFDDPRESSLGGLVWFIKDSPVVAISRSMAQCQDGRIWRRAI